MSQGETARKNFESARLELIHRIRLRDNVLLVFLASVATIFGIALGRKSALEILMVIPFLSVGAASIISQHNSIIGCIGKFCSSEIGPFLNNLSPSEYAPQWDDSPDLGRYHKHAIIYRSIGHFITLFVPCIVGLGVNIHHAIYSPFPMGMVWWFGLLCFIIAIFIVICSHKFRIHLHGKIVYRKDDHSG